MKKLIGLGIVLAAMLPASVALADGHGGRNRQDSRNRQPAVVISIPWVIGQIFGSRDQGYRYDQNQQLMRSMFDRNSRDHRDSRDGHDRGGNRGHR
ncbi:MAG: hypothetical protein KGJ62_09220 [Armatimonadetes bacterium]|nr:hypothetical protein [Armatimonadota bacterium]MDE2207594.1 hypothetical protein [Armatimonadota bacterium]